MKDFMKVVAVGFAGLFLFLLILVALAVRLAIVALIIWLLVLGIQRLSAEEMRSPESSGRLQNSPQRA